jgi:hypothetical protein
MPRTGSPLRSEGTGLNGSKPPVLIMLLLLMMKYLILYYWVFLSFLSDLLYLIIISLELYCCTCAHTHARTHAHKYIHAHTNTYTHTQTHTLGRTPLDQWSATTHNTYKTQTSMLLTGIRIRNPTKRAAAGPRLRHCGYRDRRIYFRMNLSYKLYFYPQRFSFPVYMQLNNEILKLMSRLVRASTYIHSENRDETLMYSMFIRMISILQTFVKATT